MKSRIMSKYIELATEHPHAPIEAILEELQDFIESVMEAAS